MTPEIRAMLENVILHSPPGALRDSALDELVREDAARERGRLVLRDWTGELGTPLPPPTLAIPAPRIPRKLPRLCQAARELWQAIAVTLRQMLPPPAELFPIGGMFVFGFVSYALHLLWPVGVLAVGVWLWPHMKAQAPRLRAMCLDPETRTQIVACCLLTPLAIAVIAIGA